MKASISGRALRDSLLAKLANPPTSNREASQIEALAAPRNRELLIAISKFSPRSIGELSAIVVRQQPNVSRSLAALSRAGLVDLVPDGRATVPTLTVTGSRRANELAGEADLSDLAPLEGSEDERIKPILKIDLSLRPGDLQSDEVLGQLTLFDKHKTKKDLDLNEVSTRLLNNWWRVFYRLDDPFRLCALEVVDREEEKAGSLFIKALGAHVDLYVHTAPGIEVENIRLKTEFSEKSARDLLLDRLVRPVAAYLEKGRNFDRPIHSLLRRLEDVLSYEGEVIFAKTAGALGLSPHEVTPEQTEAIKRLIVMLPDESSRLDFASSTIVENFEDSMNWVKCELKNHRQTNRFEGIKRYKYTATLQHKPAWRIGKTCAEQLRDRLGMGSDRPIGGVEGLKKIFGGDQFQPSEARSEILRGFRGEPEGIPVFVLQDMGPSGTAFLLARAIGDYLAYDNREAPISELRTDRQAMGRAFAAELLAPSDGVIQMIEEEGKTRMAVAHHYGVDIPVIAYQYANHA